MNGDEGPVNIELNTYQGLVTAFCDFLTVAIHTITYERNIYPQRSYLSAQKYDFAVRQSRHPGVCEWIEDAVTAVEAELLTGSVERLAVVIYHVRSGKPLERFMFDLSRFPQVSSSDILIPFANPPYTSDELNVDYNEQLRGVMSRLSTCSSQLGPLPSDCSFTVCLELKEKGAPPLGHGSSWIPAQPSLQAHRSPHEPEAAPAVRRGEDLGGAETLPIRAVGVGELIFEVWIEEGKDKAKVISEITKPNPKVSISGVVEPVPEHTSPILEAPNSPPKVSTSILNGPKSILKAPKGTNSRTGT